MGVGRRQARRPSLVAARAHTAAYTTAGGATPRTGAVPRVEEVGTKEAAHPRGGGRGARDPRHIAAVLPAAFAGAKGVKVDLAQAINPYIAAGARPRREVDDEGARAP